MLKWSNLMGQQGRFARGMSAFAACVCGLGCLGSMARAQSTVVYIPGLTTVAGTGVAGTTPTAGEGGPATSATLEGPEAGNFDKAGNLYIADLTGNVVRKVAAGTGIITTVAGNGTGGAGCTNGTAALSCPIDQPYQVVIDPLGNLYISDPNYNVVRKVDTSGNITVFAGIVATTANTANSPAFSGDGGPATSANLYYPTDLSIDAAGNFLYIADSKNGAIRRVALTGANAGTITAFAGVEGKTCTTGTATVPSPACGDGGLATAANLSNSVYGVFVDAASNVYIADTRTFRIRKVTAATGFITTVAGSGLLGTKVTYAGPANGDYGPALSASFVFPQRVAVDSAGVIYAVDSSDNEIRRIDPVTGIITNYIGNANTETFAAMQPGNKVNNPVGAFFDAAGFLYFAEKNTYTIRKVIPQPQFANTAVGATSAVSNEYFSTYAVDTYTASGVSAGYKDFTSAKVSGCNIGTSTAAYVTCTLALNFTPTLPGLRTAQIDTTDGTNNYVAGVSAVGTAPQFSVFPSNITTIAGTGTAGYTGDGTAATSATVSSPAGTFVDSLGNIYFADMANNVVRRFAAGGMITTVAGNGTGSYTGDGSVATSATLLGPTAVALDPSGNIFIADTGNNVVRRVDAGTGKISTFAGNGTASFTGDGASAAAATLSKPSGVVSDATGNIYIADTGNNRLREVMSGVINTVAGNGTAGETGDGAAGTAGELSGPKGLALGADSGILIADTANNVVREYLPSTGFLSKIAGGTTAGYSGDGGAAPSATLRAPAAVAVDAAGSIYIADTGNNAVRLVYGGTITTIAGTSTAGYSGDTGLSTQAKVNGPTGVAVNQAGAVIIGDTGSNAVRSIVTGGAAIAFPTTTANSSSQQNELVLNSGNLPLTLSAVTIPAGFTQKVSGGTDCAANVTLAAGGACALDLVFTPTTAATSTGSVVLTDNALNVTGAQQMITLTGTGAVIPTALAVTGLPATVMAGAAQSITVTAQASGATVPSFTGTVHFTSTDASAVLPADYTYTAADAGSHAFAVTFKTAGASVCVTVSDAAYSLSTQTCTAVIAAAPATIAVSAGNNQTAQVNSAFGTALQVLVLDTFKNPVSGATVTFTPVPAAGASATFATTTATTNSSGVATASTLTANATAGTYTVNATVTGVTAAATFTLMNSALSAPTTTLAVTPTGTVTYGQSFTLTATVSSSGATQPSGMVTFSDTLNGTKTTIGTAQTITAKMASVTETLPAPGMHMLAAAYSGDFNFAPNQANATVTVVQATPTIAGPASQPVMFTAGTAGTLIVTVTGVTATGAAAPGGMLTYTIGSGTAQTAAITNGQATLNVPNTITNGTYTIAISYAGDANYAAAMGSVTIKVNAQSQTITFAPIPAQTYGAANLTLTATASSGLAPTFLLDSGPATVTGNTLKLTGAGTVCVEADQAGNVTIAAATPVQQCFTVAKAATTTLLASSANPSSSTAAITLTATVMFTGTSFPTNPTGTVMFSNGSMMLGMASLLGSGTTYTATFVAAAGSLPAGSNSVTATYSGDNNFLTSTSTPLTQVVGSGSFLVTVSPSALTIVNGQSGIVNVTLTSLGTLDTITLSCSPLPRQSYCFGPTPANTVPANGTITVPLTIQTTATGGIALATPSRVRPPGGTGVLLALTPAGLLLALAFARRRRGVAALLSLLLLVGSLVSLAGCGSTVNTQTLPAGTPTGVTNVMVYATDGVTTLGVPVTVTVQ